LGVLMICLLMLGCAFSLRFTGNSIRGGRKIVLRRTSNSEWELPSDWSKILATELQSDRHLALRKFVEEERNKEEIYPPASETFAAFRRVSFVDTKICILGQDPYHSPRQAMGLAFSVPDGISPPPSLRNILKELESDLGCSATCDLSPWADQGVLLLNTVLTVRRGRANSHSKQGWEQFTDAVCQALAVRESPVVFLLWGNAAKSKIFQAGTSSVRIEAAHPSPLSAKRGFFGSKPFSQANTALINLGKEPIEWCHASSLSIQNDQSSTFPLRIELRCPYVEKEDCKALGGRWDPKAKTWYVVVKSTKEEEEARSLFARWLLPS